MNHIHELTRRLRQPIQRSGRIALNLKLAVHKIHTMAEYLPSSATRCVAILANANANAIASAHTYTLHTLNLIVLCKHSENTMVHSQTLHSIICETEKIKSRNRNRRIYNTYIYTSTNSMLLFRFRLAMSLVHFSSASSTSSSTSSWIERTDEKKRTKWENKAERLHHLSLSRPPSLSPPFSSLFYSFLRSLVCALSSQNGRTKNSL